MKRLLTTIVATTALLVATTAMAVPTLQLGIWDPVSMTYVGTYDTTTDTTVADTDQFVLRALLNDPAKLSLDHFISFALSGPTNIEPSDAGDYGSIGINGTYYDVTGDLTYGTPPISTVDSLGPHSIYPTFFGELQFNFNAGNTTPNFNTETQAFEGPPGSFLYYVDFNIDLSNLFAGYVMHFDLYNINVLNGTYSLGDFAPFSHDAEGGGTSVPEPATLALMGIGSALMVGMRRRRSRK